MTLDAVPPKPSVVAFALVASWLHCTSLTAQTAQPPSLTFGGFGVGLASTDVRARVTETTADQEASLFSLRAEGGIRLGTRVGVGVAFIPFAELDGDHNIGRLAVTDRQREQLWIAEVRGRAASGSRAALDVVGVLGILRQQREGSYAASLCSSTGCVVDGDEAEPSRTSPAFGAGVDVPVRLGTHVSLAGVVRLLWLRRGELDVPTWPRGNSTSFSAVVSLRISP